MGKREATRENEKRNKRALGDAYFFVIYTQPPENVYIRNIFSTIF